MYMTLPEEQRLREIVFHNYILGIQKINPNPIKVYDYIDSLCILCDANQTIVHSILNRILINDRKYAPNEYEIRNLYMRSGLNVRKFCRLRHMSQTTYYANNETEKINFMAVPKYTEQEREEMWKIMKVVKHICTGLEVDLVHEY